MIDQWVADGASTMVVELHQDYIVRVTNDYLVAEATLEIPPGDAVTLQAATYRLYRGLFNLLHTHPSYNLTRIWNFVPQINLPIPPPAEHADMYQHFNAGRHQAFQECFGNNRQGWTPPAASGMGSADQRLHLTLFATTAKPIFIENRLQTPAAHYSYRYGRTPPLFARGAFVTLDDTPTFLASGTAAIRGEDSCLPDDAEGQLTMALDNLLTLVSAENLLPQGVPCSFKARDIRLLRLYYRHAHDHDKLQRLVQPLTRHRANITLINTAICRPELLAEVEAVFSII
ncbi:MAG: hypothetical protein JO126_02975 [Alphaproteobacteria bacterium]|nr:hypothetical protein [Alphaproteobacteria bacterium]MBV8548404.1 hypothetical protein [Alphaproteobacteria bacterium]